MSINQHGKFEKKKLGKSKLVFENVWKIRSFKIELKCVWIFVGANQFALTLKSMLKHLFNDSKHSSGG